MLRNESFDTKEEIIRNLKSVAPSIFTEDKLDIDKLKALVGEDVEGGKEKFGLSWLGKSDAVKSINKRGKGTLRCDKDRSVPHDENTQNNLIIEGDNLEVLKLTQKSYFGKIKMIYIDPPYNTGNDFVYPDNYQDPLDNYLKLTGQIDENGDAQSSDNEKGGRKHSKWLSMMYPRIFMARNFLSKEGVIFISIDDNELSNLLAVMNEVFGEENFIGTISIQSNPRGRHLEKHIATSHETIVVYAKSFDDAVINKSPLDEEQKKEYNQEDENGKYRLIGLRKRGAFSKREDRPNLHYPIYYNPKTDDLSLDFKEGYVKIVPKLSDGSEGVWRWGKDKFNNEKDQLICKIVSTRNEYDVFQKDYISDETSRKYKTLWFDKDVNYENGKREIRDLFDDTTPFDTVKPLQLIKRLIRMGTNSNDIIMDFFAGSGTTAHAIMDLNKEDQGNRKYILVQLPEPIEHKPFDTIADITRERIVRASRQLDIEPSFKYFCLDSSNFREWNHDLQSEGDIKHQMELWKDPIKEGRSEEDLLYEVLLKAGFTLTANIKSHEDEGKRFYEVIEDEQHILIYLGKDTSKNLINAMEKIYANQVFFLDEAFESDDQKKNTQLQWEEEGVAFRSI